MRNSIAGRIQRLYRKNPETARRMADRVLEEVRGTPRAQRLSESELRQILSDIKNRRKAQASSEQAASSASAASAAKPAGAAGTSQWDGAGSAAGVGRASSSKITPTSQPEFAAATAAS